MIKILFLFFLVFLSGCGVTPPSFDPVEDRMLKIVEVSPSYGEGISPEGAVTLIFSKAVDPASVGRQSIFVIDKEDTTDETFKGSKADVEGGIDGIYSITEDGRAISVSPKVMQGGREYYIVVTGTLYSKEGLTLGGKLPFLSLFHVEGGISSASANSGTNVGGGNPIVKGGGVEAGSNVSMEAHAETPSTSLPPSHLMIHEIYYDMPGVDTNGDAFVKLSGEAGGALEGFYIALVNGDDGETYKTIPIPEGSFVGDDGFFVIADTDANGKTNVAGADLLDNFDPQNGPDAVQLISPKGDLVDAIGYGTLSLSVAQNGLAMFEGAPALDPPSGQSLSRKEAGADTDDNALDFVLNASPSPAS